MASHIQGTIYLICFDEPFKHARHYLGWTSNLDERIESHRRGSGGRLIQVINQHGIGWQVVRTWIGDRYKERSMKTRGHTRMCPRCKAKVLTDKRATQ